MTADVVYLIAQQLTTNAAGDSIAEETPRMVYAEVKSIGLKRKIEAEQAGLKLEQKFVLSDEAEYQGEQLLEFHGRRLNIVAVYITDDHKVELTTARF